MPAHITHIDADQLSWPAFGREVREYRELLGFLIWRDLRVRYSQTLLGVAWCVIQPLFSMGIFTVVFGWLARIPSDQAPYALFAFAGLIPWTYVAHSLAAATNSVTHDTALVSKVYFPRVLLPLSVCIGGLLDLSIALIAGLLLMLSFGMSPNIQIFFVVPCAAMAAVVVFSVGAFFSALNVRFRDVRHMVPFLTQAWFFATPVVYPSSLAPEQLRWLFALNPLTTVVEGFRWAMLGTAPPPLQLVLISTLVTVALLVIALTIFRSTERWFADVI
jgi:lipopolysaccharide transport system permease protein